MDDCDVCEVLHILETTALGAAYLAGLGSDFYPEPPVFAKTWRLERRYEPVMQPHIRNARYILWQDAVRRTLRTA